MGVIAPRRNLRHYFEPYGVQQARNLYNARKCDKGTPSVHIPYALFFSLKRWGNKWWVRLVPAAAVKLASQVAITITGLKASVARLESLW
jgi:hypothetical protein